MPLVSSHWFQFCLLGPYSKSWITFLPNNHSNMWHKIDHILLSPYYLQAEHPKSFRLKKDCNSPVQNLCGVLFFFFATIVFQNINFISFLYGREPKVCFQSCYEGSLVMWSFCLFGLWTLLQFFMKYIICRLFCFPNTGSQWL